MRAIVNHRRDGSAFKVRWRGLPPADDSWVSTEHVDAGLRQEYEDRRRRAKDKGKQAESKQGAEPGGAELDRAASCKRKRQEPGGGGVLAGAGKCKAAAGPDPRRSSERYAITFSEATVHAGGVGNAVTGAMADEGFQPAELRAVKAAVEARGGSADYFPLPLPAAWRAPEAGRWESKVAGHEGTRDGTDLEAGVLVVRDGAALLGGGEGAAARLWAEQRSFGYDRLYFNSRQHVMMRKNARYNIEFGPNGTEQAFPSLLDPATGRALRTPRVADYAKCGKGAYEAAMGHYQQVVTAHNYVDKATGRALKKGARGARKNFASFAEGDCASTVKAFSALPQLDAIRRALPDVLGAKAAGLFAEGNHYYDEKSNINFHGDGERKRVICLCLGKSTKLQYQWRLPIPDNALQQTHAGTLTCQHGDVYIMSEKATGYDWKFGRNQWPEPRLVHG